MLSCFWCFVFTLISRSHTGRGLMFIKMAPAKLPISQIHLWKALKSCGVLTAATISSISASSLMRTHAGRDEELCASLSNTDKHRITDIGSDLLLGRLFSVPWKTYKKLVELLLFSYLMRRFLPSENCFYIESMLFNPILWW